MRQRPPPPRPGKVRPGVRSVHSNAPHQYQQYPNTTTTTTTTSMVLFLRWMVAIGTGAAAVYLYLRYYSTDPAAALVLAGSPTWRVFGPSDTPVVISNLDLFVSSSTSNGGIVDDNNYQNHNDISIHIYSRAEQRKFLQQYGPYCQSGFAAAPTVSSSYNNNNNNFNNLLLLKFDTLPAPYATELWKYCVLYTGIGNVYWEPATVTPLVLWKDLLESSTTTAEHYQNHNLAVQVQFEAASSSFNNNNNNHQHHSFQLHHGLLYVRQPKSKLATGMMRYLVESTLPIDGPSLAETVGLYVAHTSTNHPHRSSPSQQQQQQRKLTTTDDENGNNNNNNDNEEEDLDEEEQDDGKQPQQQQQLDPLDWQTTVKSNDWKILRASCLETTWKVPPTVLLQPKQSHKHSWTVAPPCPLDYGGHCCQVYDDDNNNDNNDGPTPILLLRDPWLSHAQRHEPTTTPTTTTTASSSKAKAKSTSTAPPLPYAVDRGQVKGTHAKDLAMPPADLAYIATVREFPTGAPAATRLETPNFFDILLQNDCLPTTKDCFKCLKTGYADDQVGGDCTVCAAQCPCYCQALCQIRPPPKRVAAEWKVTLPSVRKDPQRLIPRILHQTWFEPVTKSKYPNMSRLIQSFQQANGGWEYEFYDDDRAAQFLSTHFPPSVRQAYDSITPGAFKADLFRYCVLFIRGGVYADMDILLESGHLDAAVPASVGFVVPQDSPGTTLGHRHCLWNGFMAVAPGHIFLARTIQNVVNHIQNRYTAVDYDDMLCPNPVLAVSHTVDTLFTCGPCILGASINEVLGFHPQRSFDYGDMDVFAATTDDVLEVDPADDPRFLIPGRSVILKQDKEDMGSHRFTWDEANLIVAATDMPDYDDRPKSLEHYSKTHEKFGVYGLHKLYTNAKRANEDVIISVVSS